MKKSQRECYCALCRSPRRLRYSRYLTKQNYLQIVALSLGLMYLTFSFVHWKGIAFLPVVWAIFESVHKSLYRKDLTCPYCGFDPKWYKKDVKFARQKVEDFLKQNPDNPILKRAQKIENYQSSLN
jgi:hypothetical protein